MGNAASSNPVLCGSIAGRPGVFGVTMHNAAFRDLGLNYTYVAFGCDDTEGAMAAQRALGIRGLGVTMPHKLRIIEYLDAIDDDAQAIGAVNTVVNDGGRLTGYNVDWLGAIRAVEEVADPRGMAVAVVGAGGGARAIAYGLLRAGAAVTIFNRSAQRGSALADHLGADFGGSPERLAEAGVFDLLAHATPVGFHDQEAMLIPQAALRPAMVVFDAVPMPLQTRLLSEAARTGCRTIAGVRMQLHQAAAQFELYTGQRPNLPIMEKALKAAIAAL